MKQILRVVMMCIVLAAMVQTAWADQRGYVWTYEYLTLAQDSAEIEYYQTAVTKDRQKSSNSVQNQQIELEYGITDRFDVGLYQVFEQKGTDRSIKSGGTKVRVRYRIAEREHLPVDVLLYAEHQEKVDAKDLFEGKLVLAKDVGKFNIAYNQVYKETYAGGDSAGHSYNAGINYELVPWLRFGIESKGNYRKDTFAAGPTIAWIGGRIWANLGVVSGLNSRSNDLETRFLLGVPF
jgi:hypothetical protein